MSAKNWLHTLNAYCFRAGTVYAIAENEQRNPKHNHTAIWMENDNAAGIRCRASNACTRTANETWREFCSCDAIVLSILIANRNCKFSSALQRSMWRNRNTKSTSSRSDSTNYTKFSLDLPCLRALFRVDYVCSVAYFVSILRRARRLAILPMEHENRLFRCSSDWLVGTRARQQENRQDLPLSIVPLIHHFFALESSRIRFNCFFSRLLQLQWIIQQFNHK